MSAPPPFDMEDYYVHLSSTPMPWIGLYVAAASFICFLAMAADAIQGFSWKKIWLPCKYFSLNATCLTLLAVAMKLPVDLTTLLWGTHDMLTKLTSTLFMSTVMGNFVTSLGSMDNKDILTNVSALSMLVVTIIVNICTQISTQVVDFSLWAETISAAAFMFVLFMIFLCCALTVPVMKRHLELKYDEMHQVASINEMMEGERFEIEKLKTVVRKYWMMAETGSLQFVIARSVTSTTTGIICLLNALTLVEAEIRMHIIYKGDIEIDSDYKSSTALIFVFQVLGLAVGTVAPLLRWFIAVKFKCLEEGGRNLKDEFIVEHYWREKLEEWKQSSLPLQIRCRELRKVLGFIKNLILDLCIILQVIVVSVSKLILFVSVWFMSPIVSCFYHMKRFNLNLRPGSEEPTQSRPTSEPGTEMDLSHYVMLLKGEAPLPMVVLRNIKNDMDKLIQKGKRRRPKNLIGLLRKSSSFTGVKEFDSSQVPSLQSKEPPYSWTLTVVTLASIAISISVVKSQEVDLLLRSLSESLSYARLVESMEKKGGGWRSIRNAADFVWEGVELHHKWLDENLNRIAREGKTCKQILQRLADVAKNIVTEFNDKSDGKMTVNPLYWPSKVLAANSMYRISQTILLDSEICDSDGESQLFEKISVLIADILAACFTNLPHVIFNNCYCNSIEERERSVHRAALLLGETEEMLNFLQQHEFSGLCPDQAASIDEWRLMTSQKSASASISTINDETIPSDEHVVIQLEA